MDRTRTLKIRKGAIGAAVAALGAVTLLGGCGARTTVVPVPAASPATTTVVVTSPAAGQRIVSYPSGRYELYGDGASMPYYWVWVPAGATLPAPPPPPGIPR
jgi:hypothetical protein